MPASDEIAVKKVRDVEGAHALQRDPVLEALTNRRIAYASLPQELKPFIDGVNKARKSSLFIDVKKVPGAMAALANALNEITAPPAEAQAAGRLPLNPLLRDIFSQLRANGFTHAHVDLKGNLAFTRNPKLAGKPIEPTRKRPLTLLQSYKIPI